MNALHNRPVSIRIGRGLLTMLVIVGLCLGAAPGRALAADVVLVAAPTTDAPPATLGPYTMLPFDADPRDTGEVVTTVAGPTGDVEFCREGVLNRIGDGWGTWSHGYAGDVYYFETTSAEPEAALSMELDEVTLYLPANTMGFYLYVEPNFMAQFPVTLTANGVSYGPFTVDGNGGASYFGFYSTGSPLTEIMVEVPSSASGFAIGEFGIYGSPETTSPRADVGVVIYGGWGGMPVQAWVGGTAQPTLYTAPNDEGHAAVLFTFWPPESTSWRVSVAPQLPGGLDPALWELKLVGIRRGATWGTAPSSGDVTITRGSQIVLYYQLLSKPGG